MKQVNLGGRSKAFLVMLLIWQVLKLGLFICVCAAICIGIAAAAGVPLLLIGLGALLMFPGVSPERKRAWAIAWW
ncbi:hypothetical protein [Microbulbifer epialgicus]|uniref:Uncharacterized protein n=1 Tax=Microbulbifer epialgicus TaxID=393907 RepID=A0ABV4NV22_9GAMM